MSTGHMVEVRLNQAYVGPGGQTTLGPQHPILYWVNKRPYCDDFLRRVRARNTHGHAFWTWLDNGAAARANMQDNAGMQVVQLGGLHGVGPGVRRPRHRLARVGKEVLFRTLLPATLHVPTGRVHQGLELCGA